MLRKFKIFPLLLSVSSVLASDVVEEPSLIKYPRIRRPAHGEDHSKKMNQFFLCYKAAKNEKTLFDQVNFIKQYASQIIGLHTDFGPLISRPANISTLLPDSMDVKILGISIEDVAELFELALSTCAILRQSKDEIYKDIDVKYQIARSECKAFKAFKEVENFIYFIGFRGPGLSALNYTFKREINLNIPIPDRIKVTSEREDMLKKLPCLYHFANSQIAPYRFQGSLELYKKLVLNMTGKSPQDLEQFIKEQRSLRKLDRQTKVLSAFNRGAAKLPSLMQDVNLYSVNPLDGYGGAKFKVSVLKEMVSSEMLKSF